ncbi:16837_t:CDS:2 [Dentiscutata erythropus]|uniref:16837_t:CDS:1 n=1 Tax=Dentiscutata erythropus TaxID=1348616 RepID=A0A9N8Z103_9GLOM|nr:16837_t:CDS:2 [Dentiscutata erythropus]
MFKNTFISFIFLFILFVSNAHSVDYSYTNTLNSDQNGTIEGLPCQTDKECSIQLNISSNGSPALGNYLCAQNQCKFVVASGQPCYDASDCAAYHYYINNIFEKSLDIDTLCDARNEKLNSRCDDVWDNSTNHTFKDPQKFCGGIPVGENCSLVATNVDPCDQSSQCINSTDNVMICDNNSSKSNSDILIGVIICLAGNIILNIGLNVQKFAFTKYQEKISKDVNREVEDNDASLSNDKKDTNFVPGRSSLSAPSNRPATSHRWHKKFEKLTFWKQIVVSPLWVTGLSIYVGGTMMGFVALKFAPQSLVAPLGAISLITNLLIAPILHKQKLSYSDTIGVIIIVGGCVIITFVPGDTIQDYDLCVLMSIFQRKGTIIYLSIIACFIISLYLFIRFVEKVKPKTEQNVSKKNSVLPSSSKNDENYLSMRDNSKFTNDYINLTHQDSLKRNSFLSSTSYSSDSHTPSQHIELVQVLQDSDTSNEISDASNNNENIKKSTTQRNSTTTITSVKDVKERILLPIAYAILASSMATMTTLFAKSLINLLSESLFHNNNQFTYFPSWIILIITVTTAFGQVYWLNMGLKKYDALIQVPIFFCNWTVFDIIGGGIYYDEFKSYSIKKYGMFIVGVLLIFSGVGILSKRLANLSKEEE